MESKTIKQIADEIGVSKQAVQKRITREPLCTCIQPYISMVGGTKYIAYIGENLVKQAFSEDNRQPVSIDASINTSIPAYIPVSIDKTDNQVYTNSQKETDILAVLQATIDTLNNQLAIKDKQIAELTETVKTQAQSINADRQKEYADKLIEGKQLIGDGAEQAEQRKKESIFSRMLNKINIEKSPRH